MTTDTNEASNTPRTDDTPRTNACPHCGVNESRIRSCLRTLQKLVNSLTIRSSRSEADLIRTQIEMQLEIDKAEAEVARLNNILENVTESRDTMIEDRNLLDQEIAASEAEVAKLNHQLLKTESDLLQSQDISFFLSGEFDIANARANKAEAEVERLTGILKSLRKSPSTEWHKSNKVLLK